jgi:MFS family permease
MERYKSVIFLNISVILLMLGVGMIVALLPQRIMNLSDSVSSVGYLASFFALTFVLFQIPLGSFSDKFGFKPFLAGGFFLCALTGLLYYFSKSSHLFLGGRMLQGVAEVPIWALAPALLSIQYPKQKGKFMGIYNASIHGGLTLGSLLGILICRTWQGNEAFLLFAGMSFLGGLLIVVFVENPKQDLSLKVTKGNSKSVISLLDNLANRTVLAGIVLYGAGYGIFITIIPAYLISEKNTDQIAVGTFFALFYIAISLSQLIAGPLSDQKGRKQSMIFGLTMATIGIASFSACRLPWLMGLLTLAAFGLGAFCVSAMAFLNECAPSSLKGTISGTFYFFWGGGYFMGPLLLGRLGQSEYWRMGFILFAVFFLFELIACFIVLKRPSKSLNSKYQKVW